ncbi:MAG: hypothetical protein PWP24_1275 [Clostridiales bacterium]|nr:hypothetical protein [Clostridiales bacterium]
MNFEWNTNTIKWYQEANAYTGFFSHIAEHIVPKLEDVRTLCDIGCGLGLLDLELAKYIEQITCVDINANAIDALKQEIQRRKIDTITPSLMDFHTMNKQFDAIVISFFGSRSIEELLPFCKKLFAIVGDQSEQILFPNKYRNFHRNRPEHVAEWLLENGVPYEAEEVSYEFGQPFLNQEEAKRFVCSLSPAISKEELKQFLEKALVSTTNNQYPLYLPHKKHVTIFTIPGRG